MRTNVSFEHPAEFVPVSGEDGVLAVAGAKWFLALLSRIPGLSANAELCQEDWGVVIFAERNKKRFWVGLSMWPESDHAWLAHLHHGSSAWLQRFSSSGKSEFAQVALELHKVLKSEPSVSAVSWYREGDMTKAKPNGASTPSAG